MSSGERNIEPLEVMQEFLLSVVESVPEELARHIRGMQNTITVLRHELETLERLEMRCEQGRRRLRQETDYLIAQVSAIADTATKASVIEPLARRLREITTDLNLLGEGTNETT